MMKLELRELMERCVQSANDQLITTFCVAVYIFCLCMLIILRLNSHRNTYHARVLKRRDEITKCRQSNETKRKMCVHCPYSNPLGRVAFKKRRRKKKLTTILIISAPFFISFALVRILLLFFLCVRSLVVWMSMWPANDERLLVNFISFYFSLLGDGVARQTYNNSHHHYHHRERRCRLGRRAFFTVLFTYEYSLSCLPKCLSETKILFVYLYLWAQLQHRSVLLSLKQMQRLQPRRTTMSRFNVNARTNE